MVSIGIRLNLRVLKVWFLALLIKIDTFIFKSLIFVLKIDSFSLKLEKETLLLFDGNCFTENPFWFWSLVWILVMQILQIVFCLDYTLCNSVLCGLFFWAFIKFFFPVLDIRAVCWEFDLSIWGLWLELLRTAGRCLMSVLRQGSHLFLQQIRLGILLPTSLSGYGLQNVSFSFVASVSVFLVRRGKKNKFL